MIEGHRTARNQTAPSRVSGNNWHTSTFTLLILSFNKRRQARAIVGIDELHAQVSHHAVVAYSSIGGGSGRAGRIRVRIDKSRRRRANLSGHFAIEFAALARDARR